MNLQIPKKAAVINSFAGYGRCSLTEALPILSAMRVQACPVPTAVFSNHTGFAAFACQDLTAFLPSYLEQWKQLNLTIDGVLCGFLGQAEQILSVSSFLSDQKSRGCQTILVDPVYVVYAPKTFILKLCIGLITGLIAHHFGHITYQTDKKKIARIAALAALGGLIFNTIFDPLVGYFYKLLILGKPAAELTLAWNITATAINTVISTIVSVLVYMALLPALKKSGLFFQVGKEGSSK